MKRRLVPDFTLLALALALSIFGLAMVYSAGQTDVLTRVTTLWHRLLLWVAIGLVAGFLASRASVRMVDWGTPPLHRVGQVQREPPGNQEPVQHRRRHWGRGQPQHRRHPGRAG